MLRLFLLLKRRWSIFLEVEGIIFENGDEVVIKSNLDFLTKEFYEKFIRNRPYVKLPKNLWAIKSENKYIIDRFDGVDCLVKDLEKKSILDPLTGCYNKKEITILLERFLKEFLRYSNPLSVLMGDIDHFKRVNDTYGHLAGDFVLKEVSKTIKSSIRDSDACGRFGGEEFLILLPNTKLIGAMKLAERIKENVKNKEFIFEHKKIKVTISIGITSASKSDSVFSLIERVDEALYEAKRKGRDRIEYR